MSHIAPHIQQRIQAKLAELYGPRQSHGVMERLLDIMTDLPAPSGTAYTLTERDAVLITYGDQVHRAGESPLSTLHRFLKQTLDPLVNTVHILPFFPYSSDDGFSVIDYYAVNPALGDWEHIRTLGKDHRLMFDAVFNHISAQSGWFQGFLRGNAPYTDYFISVDPSTDLSQVVRPRALPLLTRFETAQGEKHVWTTFSADQVDLNFANPDVLLEMLRVLLFYVQQGADLIRLDAIAFLWKTPGTTCIHLPQTHLVIQLMHDVLDAVAPSVLLVTETNVPHEENIAYLGDGTNEAQMVYQFPLPPLVLHTLHTGDGRALTRWAATLRRVSDQTTFFNFTASHDGIGVRPVTGILSDGEIAALVKLAEEHGGYVSYKTNSDGSQSPYELNITYFDAINHPDLTAAQPGVAVQRFMISQAIALAMVGVPGIYFHSLFGSRNYRAGVGETGQKRTINRRKVDADTLLVELANEQSLSKQVFDAYRKLLTIRAQEPAFDPFGGQQVLDLHPAIFALERTSADGSQRIVTLHNVSSEPVTMQLPTGGCAAWCDLLDGKVFTDSSDSSLTLRLQPYQIIWLKPANNPGHR